MKKNIIFAFVIIFLAFSLRLYAASRLPTDYDEPIYYTAARFYAKAIQTDQLASITTIDYNYEHPVFAKLIYGVMLSKLPDDGKIEGEIFAFKEPFFKTWDPFRLFSVRMVSVIFGTMAVALLFIISPVAAIALAVDSFAIKYTSVIYLEALPIFLSLLSVYLFSEATNWMKTKEKLSLRKRWKELLLLFFSAVCLGAATACKYQYGVVGCAILVYYFFWVVRNQTKDFARYGIFIGFVLISLACFVAADPYLYSDPIARLTKSMAFSLDYQNGGDVRNAQYPFYQPFVWLSHSVQAFVKTPNQPIPSTGREFYFRLDTLIFILAIIGLPKLFKERPLYFSWLMVGLLFLLIWTTKWPQYTMLVIVPLCLSTSQGIFTIYNLVKNLYLRIAKKPLSP